MEIPNYDCKSSTNNFKQAPKASFMPDSCFRMLICGSSGSGKTNILMHMLVSPLIYHDKVFLYSKNLEQGKYKKLIKRFEEIAKKHKFPLDDILHYSNDEIVPVSDLDSLLQKTIIFDDYVCEKNQNDIINYFIQGRHKNCSVIYLTQSYYKTPKDIRLNCSHYIFCDSPSKREVNSICKEQNIEEEDYNSATKKQYDFLYLDKPKKLVKRNFTGSI